LEHKCKSKYSEDYINLSSFLIILECTLGRIVRLVDWKARTGTVALPALCLLSAGRLPCAGCLELFTQLWGLTSRYMNNNNNNDNNELYQINQVVMID